MRRFRVGTMAKIERIYTVEEVLKCIPFEQEVRNKGRDSNRISDMLMFVNENLENPMFGFWIAYDDDREPIGCTVALLTLMPGQKKCVLLRMYAKQKKLKEQFEDILIEWSREHGIKDCIMTVGNKRDVRIFQRLGWKIVGTNMEMSARDILKKRRQ